MDDKQPADTHEALVACVGAVKSLEHVVFRLNLYEDEGLLVPDGEDGMRPATTDDGELLAAGLEEVRSAARQARERIRLAKVKDLESALSLMVWPCSILDHGMSVAEHWTIFPPDEVFRAVDRTYAKLLDHRLELVRLTARIGAEKDVRTAAWNEQHARPD